MAVKTLYLTTTTTSTFGTLSETAPAASTTAHGWNIGTNAVGNDRIMSWGTEVSRTSGWSSTDPQDSSPAPSSGNALVSDTAYSGTFANTSWTITLVFRSVTNATGQTRYNIRVWKSTNQDGTGATQLTSAKLTTSTTGAMSTSVDKPVTVSWSPGSLTLSNEYLFFTVSCEVTTAGTNNNADADWRITGSTGSATTLCGVTTPDFTASGGGGGGSESLAPTWSSTNIADDGITETYAALGVQLYFTVAGTVDSILFMWPSNCGTTGIGELWQGSTLVASKTVTGISGSAGWRTATFTSPASVSANTKYTICWRQDRTTAPDTVAHYYYESAYFSTTRTSSGGSIVAPADGSTVNSVSYINGVYDYTSAATAPPASTFGSTYYGVDLVFTPAGGTTYSSSVSETLSAADTPASAATFPKSFAETATAADSTNSVLAARGATAETGTLADTTGGLLSITGADVESATPTDSTNFGSNILVSAAAESASAADTPNGLWTGAKSHAETATAADSESATWSGIAPQTESGSATDIPGGLRTGASSAGETASAADGSTASFSFTNSQTESGAATDTSNGLRTGASAAAETASPADTTNSVLAAFGSDTEALTPADAPAATFTTGASQSAEAASATDTPAGLAAAVGATTETGTASDASNYVLLNGGQAAEAVTAADTSNATRVGASSMAETATIADAQTSVLTAAGAASDTLTVGDTPAGAETNLGNQVESVTAADTDTGALVVAKAAAETTTAADTAAGTYAGSPTSAETVAASDTTSGLVVGASSVSETLTSTDAFTGLRLASLACDAGSFTTDAASSDGYASAVSRPSSDVSTQWTTDSGATTGLYSTVDEDPPSDADYDTSGNVPSGESRTMELGLAPLSNPNVFFGHKVSYRYRKASGGSINVTVSLMQGSRAIASWTHAASSASFTTVTQELTDYQASTITDYGALSISIKAETP